MKAQLSILALVFLTSCDQKASVKEKIEGAWTLQKTLTTKKGFEMISRSEKYLFNNNGTYECRSVGFDIVIDEEGYFEITDDQKSISNPFLILKHKVAPNSYGDTIRLHDSFEIIKISTDSLILGHRIELLRDSFPGKGYNWVEYYVREK